MNSLTNVVAGDQFRTERRASLETSKVIELTIIQIQLVVLFVPIREASPLSKFVAHHPAETDTIGSLFTAGLQHHSTYGTIAVRPMGNKECGNVCLYHSAVTTAECDRLTTTKQSNPAVGRPGDTIRKDV
jgi:hypothetical protein